MRPVIAISAPPGGGKTSLTRALAARIEGATPVHFDDHETLTRRPPEAILAWLRRGGAWRELDVTGIADDLDRLRHGSGSGPVLFDTPLGRCHPSLAESIDFVIWLEVPLDLALARKLGDMARWPGDAGEFRSWLGSYLAHYLDGIRDIVARQVAEVSSSADVSLDGRTGIATLADQALAAIPVSYQD